KVDRVAQWVAQLQHRAEALNSTAVFINSISIVVRIPEHTCLMKATLSTAFIKHSGVLLRSDRIIHCSGDNKNHHWPSSR
ncbi:MAG: hypothetical protein AAFR31_18005, partial [Cyanobacteria bacterium J06627_8]